MALKGDTRNLRRLNKSLAQLPTVLGQQVARKAAAEITGLAQASFAAGQTVYGDERPTGKAGNALSLVETGFTRDNLRFVSDGGTKIRASLGRRYVKYLIGKYVILPIGNAALPFAWSSRLRALVHETIARALKEAA
ncbi:MAG TPA: hypothetical protein VFT98_22020 [Myxococcota bacterium]|nr:hypothetical protein [Myxococcota bacterium]